MFPLDFSPICGIVVNERLQQPRSQHNLRKVGYPGIHAEAVPGARLSVIGSTNMEKRCTKCGKMKNLAEFGKDTSRRDGLRNWCRECIRCYAASQAGRAAFRRFQASDAGKAMHCRANKRHRDKNPKQGVCHHALSGAIAAGKVIRPTVCSACGQSNGVIHGHHADYNSPYDVVWLCALCHKHLHIAKRSER